VAFDEDLLGEQSSMVFFGSRAAQIEDKEVGAADLAQTKSVLKELLSELVDGDLDSAPSV
jgi:hypothetical protein